MADLEIVKYPDPVLRGRAAPIAKVGDDVRERVRAMFALMYRDKGVGLAAPQVGWSAQLFVMNPTVGEPAGERALLNPKIVWKSKEKAKSSEGCLSLPDINGKVERHLRIRVEAMDLDGAALELELADFPARVAQHEIDHLDGILIFDRFSPAERSVADPRIADLIAEWNHAKSAPPKKVPR